jgi:DNA polymerase III delta subunit
MIYILAGNDNKNKNAYLKTLTKGKDFFSPSSSEVDKNLLDSYTGGVSLFGEQTTVVLDNALSSADITFTNEDLEKLKNSTTVFIFLEDKLLVSEEKKYKKYAEVRRFDEKKLAQKEKFNTFSIADAFARYDKVGTWIAYREAIESGVEPEAISGILFWKIKSMLLGGTKSFNPDALKKNSGELISLYHRSHRGECDFVIGLEQFILSSLSK